MHGTMNTKCFPVFLLTSSNCNSHCYIKQQRSNCLLSTNLRSILLHILLSAWTISSYFKYLLHICLRHCLTNVILPCKPTSPRLFIVPVFTDVFLWRYFLKNSSLITTHLKFANSKIPKAQISSELVNFDFVNDQLDTQVFYDTFITVLYMFRTTSCSSSGGQIILIQHLVSSLSVSGRVVNRCTGPPLTESDDTRCCINTI